MTTEPRTRQLGVRLYSLPMVGYLLRVLVSIFRLPADRLQIVDLRASADSLRNQLDALSASVEGLRAGFDQHVPALLNSLSSFHATARLLRREQAALGEAAKRDRASFEEHLASLEQAAAQLTENVREMGDRFAHASGRLDSTDKTLGQMWARIEFVRDETLFELRYGAKEPSGRASVEPKLKNPDKVEAARSAGLKLNLGSGHLPLADYVNVDARDLPGVDVIASAHDLPFDPSTVEEIFSVHLVEHFPEEQLRRQILPHWQQLLRAGGILRAVVPDAETMIREYVAGRYPFEDLRAVTFGKQDYEGDFHYTMFTVQSLRRLLADAGFTDITSPVQGRRNGKCFEMEIQATKPQGPPQRAPDTSQVP